LNPRISVLALPWFAALNDRVISRKTIRQGSGTMNDTRVFRHVCRQLAAYASHGMNVLPRSGTAQSTID